MIDKLTDNWWEAIHIGREKNVFVWFMLKKKGMIVIEPVKDHWLSRIGRNEHIDILINPKETAIYEQLRKKKAY